MDTTAAVETEMRRFLTTRSPRLPGGLKDVLALDALDDTTLLRRRPGHPCVLLDAPRRSDQPDRLEILLGDRSLFVPAWLRPAIEDLRSRSELRPVDLADRLDPQSRVVLCRRLVREGLLEVAG